MPVSERTYERLALEDAEGQWELHKGRLREKPGMGAEHTDLTFYLAHLLQPQLDRGTFKLKTNGTRVRRASAPGSVFIPDVVIVPVEMEVRFRGRPGTLEIYDQPLPLVVEIWSQSTDDYDINEKLPEYQLRGDEEIWRIHPFERAVTAWRRQPDGSYEPSFYQGGIIELRSLPGVTIDLDVLFE
ncbi:MAG: Uma2 family endonuclease [Thermomicrobiales bacterium]